MTDAETTALLEATLEAVHDGIVVFDLERRVIRYNCRFLEMFGLTAEQIEKGGSKAIADALADQLESASRELTNSDTGWGRPSAEVQDLVHFKDGRVYQRFLAPHRIGATIIGRMASYQDITQWVRIEQALQQHRAFLEKAQEVAHIGSWVEELDHSQRLTWSTETYKIFGMPMAEFAGTSEAFFRFVHPDDLDAVRRASASAVSSGRPYEIDHRIVRNDGEVRWVREKADVDLDGNGAALRLVGTVQDITDRRQLEEQLRQSQKLEAIGRLAGGVAHDLNNALTAVVGYTELALGALDESHPARPDVAEVRRAAERAESVTRQLLAFSRKQMLEPRVFHLNDTIARLGRLFERLLGGTIGVTTVTPDGLPPIYGDPGQIEQAIINLAVNARDAMPDGGRLTLAMSVVDIDDAAARAHPPMAVGRYVELAVTDTGHGMAAETQAHVFEPFFTTKGVGKGTGLGLAMVYGTVKQSGGLIFVESGIGRGTTFRLYFPAARDQPAPAAAPPRRGAAPASGATVLVVEDEPAEQNLVVAALGQQGYRVLRASSGHEALEVAAAERGIDLLLTDANMPGMSGLELARALVGQRAGLPVIIMSGYTQETLRVGGEAVALLSKPFTSGELRQKVGEVLGRGRRADPAGGPP